MNLPEAARLRAKSTAVGSTIPHLRYLSLKMGACVTRDA